MTRGDESAYTADSFTALGIRLEEVARQLEALTDAKRDLHLPALALGVAGEPARFEYGLAWGEIEDEFRYGLREAEALAEKPRLTKDGYARAESASARAVLAAVAEARKADSGKPEAHDGAGEPFPWSTAGGITAEAAGVAARTKVALEAARAKFLTASAEQTIRDRTRGLTGSLADSLKERQAKDLSALAKTSAATQRNLVYARSFSWAVIAAAMAWNLVIVPSDEDIDRAVSGWEQVAYACGEIFGHDTAAVREAVAAAWTGSAMQAADQRLVEFIAGGVHLAERARRLSQALAETVRQLGTIHKAALVLSIGAVALIAAAGLLARGYPPMRVVTEVLGRRLTNGVMLLLGLVPAAADAALALYRLVDASRATDIAGHQVLGFRRT